MIFSIEQIIKPWTLLLIYNTMAKLCHKLVPIIQPQSQLKSKTMFKQLPKKDNFMHNVKFSYFSVCQCISWKTTKFSLKLKNSKQPLTCRIRNCPKSIFQHTFARARVKPGIAVVSLAKLKHHNFFLMLALVLP